MVHHCPYSLSWWSFNQHEPFVKQNSWGLKNIFRNVCIWIFCRFSPEPLILQSLQTGLCLQQFSLEAYCTRFLNVIYNIVRTLLCRSLTRPTWLKSVGYGWTWVSLMHFLQPPAKHKWSLKLNKWVLLQIIKWQIHQFTVRYVFVEI